VRPSAAVDRRDNASKRRDSPPVEAALMSSIVRDAFRRFANYAAHLAGTAIAFFLALSTVVVWALSGPFFGFSDTWQLIINTGTTVVTFLIVFLIQTTQNRDAQAVHLKLDELLRAVKSARNDLVGLEQLSEDEVAELQREFDDLRAKYVGRVQGRKRGRPDRAYAGSESNEPGE
jgi:low affinity Fe/Cu permease